jgi:small conductance mechanosensitive channel
MDTAALLASLTAALINAGWALLSAVALWVVGRWLIRFVIRMITSAMGRQKVDATLIRYVDNTVSVLLNIVLVVAILELFGVQTTTFAALLAGAGLAIGAAWSGLLANFAAGAFLVILRPFRVGDFVAAGNITGTVQEVGLFVTTINTPDNVRTYVGNNKIFSDSIQNFTANPYRRVDLTAPVAHAADSRQAISGLAARVSAIPNVAAEPKPEIEILSYHAWGTLLAVRPFCHNDHYWQVYFDTQQAIRETLETGGFSAPEVRAEAAR